MNKQLIIREETAQDLAGITRVNELAFDRSGEARAVIDLRVRGAITLSLVAIIAEQVVGHLLFSPVNIRSAAGNSDARVVGLGPLAVLPAYQSRGIGSKLCSAGLEECAQRGFAAVFVLGHPAYYPRFGFKPAGQLGFTCQWDVPEEAFMVKIFERRALAGGGVVYYAPEFNGL